MLEIDGLRRQFGSVVALDGMTFSVPSGRLFGFLGPNGAGKTTTMRAIFGLVALDAGRITVDGRPMDDAARHRAGYMPEERGLYPKMAVQDLVVYLARLHGLTAEAARRAADELLDALGLTARRRDKVETLSQGNQQRVQLAVALAHDPDLLVLDEPFSGLDPVAVDVLGEVLRERARRGATVLFSSHQLDLVEHLCEDVAIVQRGRVVDAGPVDVLTQLGERRLVVGVDADGDGWLDGLDGVRVSEREAGRFRLALASDVDPQSVLRAAQHAGPVTYFAMERRRLSEVFREAVASEPAVVPDREPTVDAPAVSAGPAGRAR